MVNNDNFQGALVTPVEFAIAYSKNEWFRNGYTSAFKGLPYDYSIPSQRDATAYERGRAFALWSKTQKLPRAVWRNGVAAKTVQERLVKAVVHRAVI